MLLAVKVVSLLLKKLRKQLYIFLLSIAKLVMYLFFCHFSTLFWWCFCHFSNPFQGCFRHFSNLFWCHFCHFSNFRSMQRYIIIGIKARKRRKKSANRNLLKALQWLTSKLKVSFAISPFRHLKPFFYFIRRTNR